MLMIILNAVLCGALFWTCFCRIVRTDVDTVRPVRLAFCLLGAVAVACMVAPLGWLRPLLPAHEPPVTQLVIVGAMFVVQGLTARYWRDGVPCHFQRGHS